MKRIVLIALLSLASAGVAFAQAANPSGDVLGAHLSYGRGCAACHSPHSGAAGNGTARSSADSGGVPALWGEDVTGLYGQTITTGGGKYTEVLPSSLSAGSPDVEGILVCLSCHDGNIAEKAMMQNRVYERLPATYGTHNAVPTLMGGGGIMGSFASQHPVGLAAAIKCGGAAQWDCTDSEGVISMKGPRSSQFVADYGFFVKPASYNNKAVVMCTTCHDPHLMNVMVVAGGTRSGLAPGRYGTMFFLRGPYNPGSGAPGSNTTAQFCRQCHGEESNELNGSMARTVF